MNGHYPSCPAYGHPTYSACHCTSIQISLDDLRAQVAAMPDSIGRSGRAAGDLLWRNAVLALFDGTDSC